MTKLQENLDKSKQQEKVDRLQVLVTAAIKYHADNRDMLIYDLKRAKEQLLELTK